MADTTRSKPSKTASKTAPKKAVKAASKTASKTASKKTAPTTVARSAKRSTAAKRPGKAAKKPVLLAGGNPQIPKGEGDAPVQAYIDAVPEWKQDIVRELDALIVRTVPHVKKAVKWNSPFYGVEGDEGWFISYHCFDKYVKVTFFRGTSLEPMPPGESKTPETRYLDIRQEGFDESQFVDWVKQASELPGEKL
jgi:hypothetical protein